jgi:glutathione S-transferase
MLWQLLWQQKGANYRYGSAASRDANVKLFITLGSPYARMARITVLEKQLESLVEVIVVQTRTSNSPYYAINPSGRVPYLRRDDGVGLEESAVICAWLDHLATGAPTVHTTPAQARINLETTIAIERAVATGQSVRLPLQS